MTVGFPLNTDEFRAVFTMGVRFSTVFVGSQQELTVAVRSRPATLVALTLFAWAAANLGAQAVTVSRVADAVAVRAPGFTFIKGEPLVRLKDGRSVRVDLDLAVLPRPGDPAAARSRQTFVLSYDLWEERFAVTLVGTPPQSVAYLTSTAAEAWCLEQLTVPVSRARPAGRATCRSGFGSSTESSDGDAAPDRTTTARALRCGD